MKTSIIIPDDLWILAKTRAAIERKNLADVVADALRSHLKTKPEKPSAGKPEKK